MPSSQGAAFAAVLWGQTRLRLRGLRFVPRDDQDELTLLRLEALRSGSDEPVAHRYRALCCFRHALDLCSH